MNQNKSASKKSKNDENKENSSNKPTGENNKVKNQPGNKKSAANKLQVQNTENKQKKDDATTTNRRLKDSNAILTESTKWSSFIGEQKQQNKADEKITVAAKKKEKAPKKKLELETSSSNTNKVNIDAVSKRAKTSYENEKETSDALLRLPINDTPRKSDPIVNFPNIGLSLPMTPLPVHFYKYDEDRNLFSFELIENVRTFYFSCLLRINFYLKFYFLRSL